eukprot:Em0005g1647a
MISSIISGFLFSLGWWLAIDAVVDHSEPLYGAYLICGAASTLALLMINSVSTGQITGDTYNEGCIGQRGARAWLFVGFVLAFGGLLGSLWVLIQQFIVDIAGHHACINPSMNGTVGFNVTANLTTPTPTVSSSCQVYWWQGFAFFIQNLLIFISTLVFKFGRTEEESW